MREVLQHRTASLVDGTAAPGAQPSHAGLSDGRLSGEIIYDHDPVPRLRDPPHGRVQRHALAELRRARRAPRRSGGHLFAQALETTQHELEVHEREHRQRGDRSSVAPGPAAQIEPRAAIERRGRGAQPELAREPAHALVRRADVLRAQVEDGLADLAAQRPPADAVARLEHGHRQTRRDQPARRRKPGEAGADDDHVDRIHEALNR
ncbi:MAG: hypothetical protein WEF50_17900 [Myxococcota bacterium]